MASCMRSGVVPPCAPDAAKAGRRAPSGGNLAHATPEQREDKNPRRLVNQVKRVDQRLGEVPLALRGPPEEEGQQARPSRTHTLRQRGWACEAQLVPDFLAERIAPRHAHRSTPVLHSS